MRFIKKLARGEIKRFGLTNLGTKRLNFRNSLKEGYE